MYGCAVIHPTSGATLVEYNHFGLESVAQETLLEEVAEYCFHCHHVIGLVYSLDSEGAELLQGGLYWSDGEHSGEVIPKVDDPSQNLIDSHMEAFLEHVRRNRCPRRLVSEPSNGIAR